MTVADQARKALEVYSKTANGYVDMQRLLIRYGMECFFRRLAVSRHANTFILKGATSFAIHMEGARNTADSDFQVYGRHDANSLRSTFEEICAIALDDGIAFGLDRILIDEAGARREYTGFKVHVPAALGNAGMSLQFDIGFGEVVTPPAPWTNYPSLLGGPGIRIKIYPIESIVSEKFEAMVDLGMRNGRMKDFYDIAEFAAKLRFNSVILAEAVKNTFAHRKTVVPSDMPLALTERFFKDKEKQKEFKGFLRRHSLPKLRTLESCCLAIQAFIMPVCNSITSGRIFSADWWDGEWRGQKAEEIADPSQ